MELRPRNRFELAGETLTPGYAIGKAFKFKQIDLNSLRSTFFSVDKIDNELLRFEESITKSIEQLTGLLQASLERDKKDVADIFATHIQLLQDESFIETIRETLKDARKNIEHVLSLKIYEVEQNFTSTENETIKTKLFDIQDVYQRLLRNLLGIEHVRVTPLVKLSTNPILIAEHLLPSDIALLEFKKIKGIIMEQGSTVSHVAIITRSFGIPALVGVQGASTVIHADDLLIIDGFTGKVIVNPSEAEVSSYTKKSKSVHRVRANHLLCMTKDGVPIKIEANANTPEEIEDSLLRGAEGIGLVRTEIFYLTHGTLPTLSEEIEYYKKMLQAAGDSPVTFRLLDIGADKSPPYLPMPYESNPQLGVRGIRFLLANPDILYRQIYAILKVHEKNPAKILLPFVTLPDEIVKAKTFINNVCKEMRKDCENVKLGIMIEIPSILYYLHKIAPLVDFVSIGTNDLTQFLFAASREEDRLLPYKDSTYPVIIQVIRNCVNQIQPAGKLISVCGEIASDTTFTLALIGAGIRNLSVQPGSVENVMSNVQSHTLQEAHQKVKSLIDKLI